MKPCPPGSSRNVKTKRCRKDCKDTQERNSKGRCVKRKIPGGVKKTRRRKKGELGPISQKRRVSYFNPKDETPIPVPEKKQIKRRKQPLVRNGKKAPKKKQPTKKITNNIVRNGRVVVNPLLPSIPLSVRERMGGYGNEVPVCNISSDEVKALFEVFLLKYENRYDSCKLLSSMLKLPDGAMLTEILSNGSYGIVVNAQTRSGSSYVAKIVLISPGENGGEVEVKGEKKTMVWNSVTEKMFKDEIRSHTIVYELYEKDNLMGDIQGAFIPSIKDHYTTKVGGRKVGVILMEKIKGTPLGHLMATATEDSFDRVLMLFYKFVSIIGRFHYEGVIHGDPHVWNVLVIDGTDDMAIIDFGETVLYEERLGPYRLLSRGDPRFEIHGSRYLIYGRRYDQIQAMAFFIFMKDLYFSKRLNGGLDVLDKINELFNPGYTKVVREHTRISQYTYTDSVSKYVYEYEYTHKEYRLKADQISTSSRKWAYIFSKGYRMDELPGGRFYEEEFDREWTDKDDIEDDILSIKYYRPPDTTRIVLYQR